jgi:hypothetical protein
VTHQPATDDDGTPTAGSWDPRPPKRRRPAAVTILAGFQLLSALAYAASAATLAGAELNRLKKLADFGLQVIDDGTIVDTTLFSILVVMTIVGLAAAILLLRMKQAGWTITMLVTGWSLASQIYLYVTGGGLVPGIMIVNVVTVLYLNQRGVRAAFGIGIPRPTAAAEELDERA